MEMKFHAFVSLVYCLFLQTLVMGNWQDYQENKSIFKWRRKDIRKPSTSTGAFSKSDYHSLPFNDEIDYIHPDDLAYFGNNKLYAMKMAHHPTGKPEKKRKKWRKSKLPSSNDRISSNSYDGGKAKRRMWKKIGKKAKTSLLLWSIGYAISRLPSILDKSNTTTTTTA